MATVVKLAWIRECIPVNSHDLNVVLNDSELTAEIAAANGSMREVMSRIKRLARRRQSASTP